MGLLALSLFFSCVPSRDIREAKDGLPEQYTAGQADTLNSSAVSWRVFFGDPDLRTLIDSALVRNQELNIMVQQVDIARNEVRARTGEYLPSVGLQAGAEVEKVGRYTRSGAVEDQLDIREGEAFPEPLTDFQAGLAASWELDIWKKLRNSKKAAVYEYLASVEGRRFMVTNLVAEIAASYYELVALDNQLVYLRQNLEIQQNALDIVKLQKQAARATELAVRRFEAEVFKNQSQRFEIQQQIVETENRINFLTGRGPGPVRRRSEPFIDMALDTVYSGIPAQLLTNRPDIRQAEFELEAAKLDVKSARASFLPSVGIRAGIGFQAFKPGLLGTTPESLVYNAVGDLVAPLINRNALKAAYNSATDRQLQAVYEYEKAILGGYVEVVNQLSNIENLRNGYQRKLDQVDALTESIDLSTRLFQSARVEYLEVLLTQREALEARMELVEAKKFQMLARIDLYHSLGGGWN